MILVCSFSRPACDNTRPPQPRVTRLLPLLGLAALLVALPVCVQAQVRTPAATPLPIDSPAPVASPVPSVTPLPGDPTLYLPQATVQLPANASTPAVAKTTKARTKTKAQSQTKDAAAVTSPVQLLEVCAPDVFAITTLPANPPAVTVTLLYDPAACATLKATIAPLDGGQLDGRAGPKQFAIGADGKVTFTYQPPASPGNYNVVTSLGTYQRTLPFQVLGNAAPAN